MRKNKRIEKGEVVGNQQGEQGGRFYIIVHGQVKVETCNHYNENIYQLPSSNDETKTNMKQKVCWVF